MAERAQITSVEAIESFRAKLIEFLAQMRPALGEVGSEVIRTRVWLQDEHRLFWEKELRLRFRRLEEAKQEMFTATLSQMHDSVALRRMAMQRAQNAVREAEAKLLLLKKWGRELENRTAPLMKQVDQLYSFLATDMVRGVTHLDQIMQALDAYRAVAPAHTSPTVAAEPEKSEESQ
jgi:hypothetical protein